jgi:hypothetical protein
MCTAVTHTEQKEEISRSAWVKYSHSFFPLLTKKRPVKTAPISNYPSHEAETDDFTANQNPNRWQKNITPFGRRLRSNPHLERTARQGKGTTTSIET